MGKMAKVCLLVGWDGIVFGAGVLMGWDGMVLGSVGDVFCEPSVGGTVSSLRLRDGYDIRGE